MTLDQQTQRETLHANHVTNRLSICRFQAHSSLLENKYNTQHSDSGFLYNNNTMLEYLGGRYACGVVYEGQNL